MDALVNWEVFIVTIEEKQYRSSYLSMESPNREVTLLVQTDPSTITT